MSVHDTEALLSALAERETLLRRERIASAHATALLRVMDALSRSATLEEGMRGLLHICLESMGADAALILRPGDGEDMTALAADPPDLAGPHWPGAAGIFATPRRVGDLRETPWRARLPAAAQRHRSFMAAPLAARLHKPMALALLSTRKAAFSRFDHALLQRIAGLLENTVDRLQLAQRTAVLARVVDNSAPATPEDATVLDASFTALSNAYRRTVNWQGQIVDVTNRLLSAPTHAIDQAIGEALQRIGELARCDRTYVFRLRAPDRIDNTHEWTADGVAPMIDQLQDMPDTLLTEWLPDLQAARPVEISDVADLPDDSAVKQVLQMQAIRSLLAVPMDRNGALTGFVGFDAVKDRRRFLPMEVQLLQSVANAINVVLDRAAAETEAETARRRLQEERDRLQATFSAIPDLVLEIDQDGRFTGYNAGASVSPIVPAETFLGRLPEEVLPAPLPEAIRRVMRKIDRDGRAEPTEYALEVAGETRWFIATAAARTLHGAPGGYVLVVRDITQRHRQSRQIQRLGKIAELTSNLVVVTDAKGRIDWVNPAFEKRTGWRLDEVRGETPGRLLQFERTDPEVVRRVGDAIRQGRAVQAELLNRARSGEAFWVRKDIQPLVNADGTLEGFVSVQTDITEMKRSQDAALRERAAAMDASSDGIAITDAEGRYTFMNKAHRRMFGIGEDEDVGRLTWRDLCSPDTVARFLEEEAGKLQAEGAWRGEVTGRHRDGGAVHQEVSLTLKADGGLICITRDISRRLRLQAEQSRLREELQLAQRRETIAHVASGVAHDVNNLMAVVAGSAARLETLCADHDDAVVAIARVQRAVEAAGDLVAGLASLGRPDAPRGEQDLCKLVAAGVELLGGARAQKHDIAVVTPGAPCMVWANATEILQVVVNLTLNACEAAPAAEAPRVRVEVLPPDASAPRRPPDVGAFGTDGRHILFTVADTGAGIDASTHERLFETYFTTKGDKGTGLGLPIVAGILRKNGGALWFDSRPGLGATVTVAWPVGAPEAAATASGRSVRPGAGDLSGTTIMVVDDVADVAEVLADMLEDAGAVAVAVSNPADAQTLLTDSPGVWSAIVTDLHMPEIDGGDLARRAAALIPSTPTIAVTALPEAAIAADAPFHAILAKPVDPETLAKAVRDAVDRHS